MFRQIGFGELLLILGIALVVFGPKKLPELGRSLGRGIREFKQGLRDIDEPEKALPRSESAAGASKDAGKEAAGDAVKDAGKEGEEKGV